MESNTWRILLTGATGFVGGRLLSSLSSRGYVPRLLVRSADRFRHLFPGRTKADLVEADLLDPNTLARALEEIDLVYYLVHSMGGQTLSDAAGFAQRDRLAAGNLIHAADRAGVRRIIYLGGLGETGRHLSEHLASRQEVAEILKSGRSSVTILRAANIIGAGGAPFEMLRHLVERLPVVVAPRWIDTRCQPISIDDVTEYLIGCMEEEGTRGKEFDIGGPDIITYREMMSIYARVRGLKRLIVAVPLLTPRLSSIWISLLTPVPSGVVGPLLQGLKNEVICRENRIRELIPIPLTPIEVSICNALQEVRDGPGKLLSRQACFLSRDFK
ncbi:MAG: NAD(P)H-binding protein [Syntrophobacteraceae bacterium]